jgi:ubiquinone/menaquinone biosynthesis C-methylase UbiE
MWEVSKDDFDAIQRWGLSKDPFAAVKDFDQVKVEQRWLNPEQNLIHSKYVKARQNYIKNKDFDNYYRDVKMPIDRTRWEFLMNRKAWFITPLGWDSIAINGGRVIDLGCGDGDVVQRLANYVHSYWESNNISGLELSIIGIDLNESRVQNAVNLVRSPSKLINIEFHQGNVIGEKLEFCDHFFDFGLTCGVLEILDDNQCNRFLDELSRIVKRGIYIEDLFEKFPGGFPRDYLGRLLLERDFIVRKKHVLLSEPFNTKELQDPKKLWPVLLDQNLWAEKITS